MIGKTREMIVRQSKRFTVVSLPRGVFMPYTPTKTNIVYFEKGGQFKNVFFFAVLNDGFELNTKRKPISGDSDIKTLLSEVDDPRHLKAQANIVDRETIQDSGNWNLRPFYYMEDVPEIDGETIPLSYDVIENITEKVNPGTEPDRDWNILEVSQNGIFLGDTIKGSESTQEYKLVRAGDIAYNPYRINIGSVGVVPPYLDGGLVSPAYVVVRPKQRLYPASYIVSVLKHSRYMRVIMNYSLSSARASLPFEELIRIKIPKPSSDELRQFASIEQEANEYENKAYQKKSILGELVSEYVSA